MEDVNMTTNLDNDNDRYPSLSPDITAATQTSLAQSDTTETIVKEESDHIPKPGSPRRMTRSQSLEHKQLYDHVDVPRKKEQIRKEMTLIWNGTHPKLLQQRRALSRHQEEKILLAELWKTYQLGIIEKLYQQERLAAEKEFETQKNQIREKMIQDLLEKKRKWLEEHHEAIITQSQQVGNSSSQSWIEDIIGAPNGKSANSSIQRKLRKRNHGVSLTFGNPSSGTVPDNQQIRTSERISGVKSKKGPVGPTIVASLKEFEIDEDLDIIRQKKNDGMATRRYKYSGNTKTEDQRVKRGRNTRSQNTNDEIRNSKFDRNVSRDAEGEDEDMEEESLSEGDDVYDETVNVSS